MATIDLKKISATAINTEFWDEFLDALSSELELLRSQIAEKEDFFYVRDQNDTDRLIEISKTFGFTIDRSINTTNAYLKNNLNVTSNRVKHKTSYTGYSYYFSLAEYFGQVYNFFVQNDLFVRGYDFTETITNLDAIIDYSLPFVGFEPELYFKVASSTGITLDYDPEWFLDGDTVLTLDQEAVRTPTTHLAIEFIPQSLLTESAIEYYMTNTYLEYLLEGSKYNKKATEVPHVGVQVNGLMDLSGYYDNLSNDTHSTPALKLNAVTTQANYFNEIDELFLDEETISGEYTMDLDKEVSWRLDQSANIELNDTMENLFSVLKVGNSYKGVMSKNYPDLNEGMIGYWDFDETSGSTFLDSTSNNYNGTLNGSYTRGLAIIGQGVLYDGSTAYGLASDIFTEPTIESVSFWVKGEKEDQIQSGNITIMQLYNVTQDYIQVQYDLTNDDIIVSMTGNSITYNVDLLDDIAHHIAITYNDVSSQYELFIDGVSVATQAFGGSLPPTDTYDLYVAVDQGLTEYFKGYIDEIRFYAKVLTDNEIGFLYSSKLGNLDSLGNILYTRNNAITILDENTDWFVIACRFDFSDDIQSILDDDCSYPTEEEKKTALDNLYEEIVGVREFGIFDVNGEMKIYMALDDDVVIELKKKNHISIQALIKKTS